MLTSTSHASTYTSLKYTDIGELGAILRSPYTSDLVLNASRMQLDVTLEDLSHIFGIGWPTYDYWISGSDELSEVLIDMDMPAPDIVQLQSLKYFDIVVPKLDSLPWVGQADAVLKRLTDDVTVFPLSPLAKSMRKLQTIRLLDRRSSGGLVITKEVECRQGRISQGLSRVAGGGGGGGGCATDGGGAERE